MSCSSEDCDTDQETDRLLGSQRSEDRTFYEDKVCFCIDLFLMCFNRFFLLPFFILENLESTNKKEK